MYSLPGQDVEHPVEITIQEAYLGTIRTFTMTNEIPCPQCSFGALRRNCKECNGTGFVSISITVQIHIPAGVDTGIRVRSVGEGSPGMNGGKAGNFYLLITVRSDSIFSRDKDDLYVSVEVEKEVARAGGEIGVPLPDGTEVYLSLPPCTSHKRLFRLPYRGMPIVHSASRGHLYVQILVMEGVGRFSTRKQQLNVPKGQMQQEQSQPKILGNYHLLNILGEGGFATVYLGEHVHLKTLAAVKLLRGKMTQEDIQQFQLEARTIANLRHSHIVRMLDFGVEEKRPYLIMEYAANGTLRERHEEGMRVPLSTVLNYVEHIADALQYAHNRNLVHRDIKPANMLIGEDKTLLLSDFGLAMRAHKTQSLSTQDAIGTISYMAPEQIRGKPRLVSDQYSLAVVVYEWLCGKCPFDGDTAIDIAMQHLLEPPPSLCAKVPYLSSDVEEVILRALSKNPLHRFEDVSSFSEALIDAGMIE